MSSVTASPSEELAKSLIKCHTKGDSFRIHWGYFECTSEIFGDTSEIFLGYSGLFRGFNWTNLEDTLEIFFGYGGYFEDKLKMKTF